MRGTKPLGPISWAWAVIPLRQRLLPGLQLHLLATIQDDPLMILASSQRSHSAHLRHDGHLCRKSPAYLSLSGISGSGGQRILSVSELLFGLTGLIAGTAATLIAPWISERLSRNRQQDLEREAEEKRNRDHKFDRLVLLRESTRMEVLYANKAFGNLKLRGFTREIIALEIPVGMSSEYTDMARGLSEAYPGIPQSYFSYLEKIKKFHSDLHGVQARAVNTLNLTGSLHIAGSLLAELEGSLRRLRIAREILKVELLSAAQDLGYDFVMHEDNRYRNILDP